MKIKFSCATIDVMVILPSDLIPSVFGFSTAYILSDKRFLIMNHIRMALKIISGYVKIVYSKTLNTTIYI